MAGRLSRDVFVAPAAIGWADGHLDPVEADGIVGAALESGLDLEEIPRASAATLEVAQLPPGDRPSRLDFTRLHTLLEEKLAVLKPQEG